MNAKFLILPILAATVLIGCQSGSTNIYHSRNSEAGRAIADLDKAEKLHNARVRAFQKAMMDYEAAHNGTGRMIYYHSLSQPIEVIGPKIVISNLEGAYKIWSEFVNYKVRITYEDEARLNVKQVEVLEKLTK